MLDEGFYDVKRKKNVSPMRLRSLMAAAFKQTAQKQQDWA
jgi:hypothetical protein